MYSDTQKKLPVGSCLLEAAGLQDDRILQYSFLRVPRGEKEESFNLPGLSCCGLGFYLFCLDYKYM
jgi:hypothetical protein